MRHPGNPNRYLLARAMAPRSSPRPMSWSTIWTQPVDRRDRGMF
jgi:hypothetical protein